MHRAMHILDVISSVSRPSKCNEIVDPTGRADSAPPNPLAGFKAAYIKASTFKRSGREGGLQNDICPGARNLRAATARPR